MLLYLHQIFIFLLGNLHFFLHFFFSFMENLFKKHPIHANRQGSNITAAINAMFLCTKCTSRCHCG